MGNSGATDTIGRWIAETDQILNPPRRTVTDENGARQFLARESWSHLRPEFRISGTCYIIPDDWAVHLF